MHRFFPPVSALLYILLSALPLPAGAQASSPTLPTTLEGWADRLARFGKGIPQEKVYVHMDNTCYFLGDTLWFAAYTRRTDTDVPSDISHVLYAELFDQDGYLVERQLIEMQGGHGYGNFALPDTLYAGYYELRAYTRWQLNWGVTEKEHTSYAEEWFFNKEMAKEFYCDYDKLYSRVFPVYDKPGQPGEFYHDMTARPLRRYFKSGAPEPQPVLSLFPEGGNLVAGVPCRVAFEAATEAGEALEGKLVIEEAGVGDIPTVNRGRGVFTFTPEAGRTYEAVFTASDGRTARAKLPAAEPHGVALSVQYPATSSQEPPSYVLTLTPAGEAATKPLGVTIMREGVVLHTEVHDASAAPVQILFDPSQGQAGGTPGIYQATVFDADGRIYADRLFFVTSPALAQPTLTVEGLKEQYAPYEEATLTLQRPAIPSPGIQRPAIPSPGPPPPRTTPTTTATASPRCCSPPNSRASSPTPTTSSRPTTRSTARPSTCSCSPRDGDASTGTPWPRRALSHSRNPPRHRRRYCGGKCSATKKHSCKTTCGASTTQRPRHIRWRIASTTSLYLPPMSHPRKGVFARGYRTATWGCPS